jgi:hypothetical protein
VKGTLHFRPRRLKQAAVLTGVGTLAAAALVLGSTAAYAGPAPIVGTDHGKVVITDTTTPGGNAGVYNSNDNLAWSTSEACPAGLTGSAALFAELPNQPADGDAEVSAVIPIVTGNFSGNFTNAGVASTIASLNGIYGDLNGATVEFYIECAQNPSLQGNNAAVMDTFATVSADGSTFTLSANPPASTATTTTLNASTPAYAGQNVTLTATVAGGSTTPSGTVTFTNGGVAITGGTNVSLVNGMATLTTQFAAPGTETLAAAYTSSDTTKWANSSGTNSLNVTTAPTNAIPLTVTVPTEGSFTLTVGTTTVNLTPDSTGLNATGTIPNGQVKVTDTRNNYPGWIVSGQDSAWTGSGTAAGGTFSGNQLGWTPTLGTTVATGVTKGPNVTAAAPGLGSAAVLAQVAHGSPNGFGESDLGAGLDLIIPASAPAGPYASSLTITAVTTN